MKTSLFLLLCAALFTAAACGGKRATEATTESPAPGNQRPADATAQPGSNQAPDNGRRVTRLRLDGAAPSQSGLCGSLIATIDGRDTLFDVTACGAWIIAGGQAFVYSSTEGAGGFENEGQSLHYHHLATGKTRRIMSEYAAVDSVIEALLSTGRTALLVTMSDGGLGAEYLAVLDPWRGQVAGETLCRIGALNGDKLRVDYYTEDDWHDLSDPEPNARKSIRPHKTKTLDLVALLSAPVMENKRAWGGE